MSKAACDKGYRKRQCYRQKYKVEKVKEKMNMLSWSKGHGGYECPSVFIGTLYKIKYIYEKICIQISVIIVRLLKNSGFGIK